MQTRQEGTIVPQGLSLTPLGERGCAWILWLGDVQFRLRWMPQRTWSEKIILGVYGVTLNHPEFPGKRIAKTLWEVWI